MEGSYTMKLMITQRISLKTDLQFAMYMYIITEIMKLNVISFQ